MGVCVSTLLCNSLPQKETILVNKIKTDTIRADNRKY